MQAEDRVRRQHMLDAASAAMRFMAGRRREALDTDQMLLFAVVRAVELVGEAAARVSDATRHEVAELPWRAIVGMRNRLIHGYFDIDTEVVWRTIQTELPPLVKRLGAALAD